MEISVVDPAPFGQYAPRGLCRLALSVARRCADGWWSRRLAYAMRAAALTRLREKPLDVVSLGARMRLYPQRSIAEKRLAFTPQYFDPGERAWLAERLKGDFVFLDVGASCGGYALFAASLGGPRSKILAVEPQPEVFARLVYNITQSAYVNLKAVGCAVLDIDGEATLFVNKSNEGESSVRIVNADARVEPIRVPTKTLLTLAREEGFERIDAIKLDIEGAEALALESFFAAAPPALWPKFILMAFGWLRTEDSLEMRAHRSRLSRDPAHPTKRGLCARARSLKAWMSAKTR